MRSIKIKICGITNLRDAKMAVELGAYMLGFNFYKKSPRYVTPKKAQAIISKLPKLVLKAGIFVNHSKDEIEDIANYCRLDYIQLHGDESPEFCKSLKKYKIIKAIRIKDKKNISRIKNYNGCVKAVLLDTYLKKSYGGTGKTFDWKLARQAKKYKIPIFLAGGLGPNNILKAINIAKPYAVDICSGIEKSPGKKDYTKISFLFNKLSF